tara:strand:- start:144 stop:344 length:201 start_codon:yes stop_codon:yes gene_type:complete
MHFAIVDLILKSRSGFCFYNIIPKPLFNLIYVQSFYKTDRRFSHCTSFVGAPIAIAIGFDTSIIGR